MTFTLNRAKKISFKKKKTKLTIIIIINKINSLIIFVTKTVQI